MMIVGQPPAIVSPAPIPSRNLMVWGEQPAQDAIRATLERKGWKWMTFILGEQTPALVLLPPAHVTDEQVTALINDVNAGKHGKLNGGYGQIGTPAMQTGTSNS